MASATAKLLKQSLSIPDSNLKKSHRNLMHARTQFCDGGLKGEDWGHMNGLTGLGFF
jgi:hypothetical protein